MKYTKLLIILMLAATTAACSHQKPEIEIRKTIESLYEAVNEADVEAVCSHLMIPENNRVIFNSCIKGVLDDYRDKGGISSVFVREVIIDDVTPDKAQVKYVVTLGNSAVESYDADMVRINGKWKKID